MGNGALPLSAGLYNSTDAPHRTKSHAAAETAGLAGASHVQAMRFRAVVMIPLLGLSACATPENRPPRDSAKSATAGEPPAKKAGKAAHRLAKEAREAAQKADQKLREAAHQAREGWNEAERQDREKQKK